MEKPITWVGSTKNKIKSFPVEARQEAGYQLNRVQQGLLPIDWKPMVNVGPGVIEIRIHEPHEYRVIYVAKYAEAVYVLHAFEKKARKTNRCDLESARRAYKAVLNFRRREL